MALGLRSTRWRRRRRQWRLLPRSRHAVFAATTAVLGLCLGGRPSPHLLTTVSLPPGKPCSLSLRRMRLPLASSNWWRRRRRLPPPRRWALHPSPRAGPGCRDPPRWMGKNRLATPRPPGCQAGRSSDDHPARAASIVFAGTFGGGGQPFSFCPSSPLTSRGLGDREAGCPRGGGRCR